MRMDEWDYIGDGVYVKPDQFGVWLHANDHKDPTDKIYLELPVLDILISQVMEMYKNE